MNKPKSHRFKDITGQTFGNLTAIGISGKSYGTYKWQCRCLCGNTTQTTAAHLLSGHTKSCGCLRKTTCAKLFTSFGHTVNGITPEYRAYANAKNRCTNRNYTLYNRYGGRGIEFRFTSFQHFAETVGQRPSAEYSLDRIDNNGHYEPGNIRWAKKHTQARNKNTNLKITIDGTSKSAAEWADISGIKDSIIRDRLHHNWCGRCSVFNKIGQKCKHKLKNI